jgi:hypothetical protein
MKKLAKDQNRPPHSLMTRWAVMGMAGSILGILLALSIGLGLIIIFVAPFSLLGVVARILPRWLSVLVMTVTAFGIGVVLYQLRTYGRMIYGYIELGFAIGALTVTSYQLVTQLTSTETVFSDKWVAFAGAVYLIVRGCDNIVEGHKQLALTASRKELEERNSLTHSDT